MIIPDPNLLIYAHDELANEHAKARRWWEDALSGSEPIGLPWVIILAFTRLLTHPQICQNPLSLQQVRGIVASWTECPQVRVLQLSDEALPAFFDLLEEAGMGGNLTTGALIALHAREYSATVYSNDLDFGRFHGIRWKNPLA